MAKSLPPQTRVSLNQLCWEYLFVDTHPGEKFDRVGRDLNSCTNFSKFRRCLENCDCMALLDEVDSQCQTSEAGTNNQDVDFEIRGVLGDGHCDFVGQLLRESHFIRDIGDKPIRFRNC